MDVGATFRSDFVENCQNDEEKESNWSLELARFKVKIQQKRYLHQE